MLEVLFQTNHNCQLFAFVAYQLLLPRRRAKDAEAAALQQLSEWGFGEEAAQRALLADRAEGGAQEDLAVTRLFVPAGSLVFNILKIYSTNLEKFC